MEKINIITMNEIVIERMSQILTPDGEVAIVLLETNKGLFFYEDESDMLAELATHTQ